MEELFRADIALVKSGLVKSRELAKLAIESGLVLYLGKQLKKPSQKVLSAEKLVLIAPPIDYVGRGGMKLEKAIQFFQIRAEGKVCLDIGASTGGFTDCLLQNGAAKVYAVDVGSGQLAESLRTDKRVASMENTDFRNLVPTAFEEAIELISADVSFISLKHLFPIVKKIAPEMQEVVFLVKPQFEAGRDGINSNGIVTNPKVHVKILEEVLNHAESNGLHPRGLTHSPITGQDGNIEYLLYCAASGSDETACDIKKIVQEAFSNCAIQKRRRCK